jgi:hypothetical protein
MTGVALKPTVIELGAEAQRQEAARRARGRRLRHDWVGTRSGDPPPEAPDAAGYVDGADGSARSPGPI